MNIKIFLMAILLILLSVGCKTETITQLNKDEEIKILFIGNSITYYNNMILIFEDIAEQKGYKVMVEQLVQGGVTLKYFEDNPATVPTINLEKWDYVVLQDGDYSVIFEDNFARLAGTVNKLRNYILMNNNKTKILYQMLHPHKNGNTLRSEYYDYKRLHEKIREGTVLFAKQMELEVVPVGWAWKIFRDTNSAYDLYLSDNVHPSYYGSYLNACVFFNTVFKESCIHQADSKYLTKDIADSLQKTADKTLDKTLWNF